MTEIIDRVHRLVDYHVQRNRLKLYPGVHWVWDSFTYMLPNIFAVIILSEHTVENKELLLCSQAESLLKDSNHVIEVTETENNLDGNYLVLDSKRNSFIPSGCAEMGIVNRWKEHTSAAKLPNVSSLNSVFYMSYPYNNNNIELITSD